jgi:hypothetical protein
MKRGELELTWRSVLADSGNGYAAWVRELSDQSGVYLIRSDPSRFADQLLYIGESHTYSPGKRRSYRGLYRTLTRHFQGHGWEQGITYDPRDVVAAVIITPAAQAVELQDWLIATYKPRDNEHVKELRFEAWGITPEQYEAAQYLDDGQSGEEGLEDLPPEAFDFPAEEWN